MIQKVKKNRGIQNRKMMMTAISNMVLRTKIIEENYLLQKMGILVKNGLLKNLMNMIELQRSFQTQGLEIITIAEIQTMVAMFGATQQILMSDGSIVI